MKMSPEEMTKAYTRMVELSEPIERQIMMTDTPEDMLMLASVMLQRSGEIFDTYLSPSASDMVLFEHIRERMRQRFEAKNDERRFDGSGAD